MRLGNSVALLVAALIVPAHGAASNYMAPLSLGGIPGKPSWLSFPSNRMGLVVPDYRPPKFSWEIKDASSFVVASPNCESKSNRDHDERCGVKIVDGKTPLLIIRADRGNPNGYYDAGYARTHYIQLENWPPTDHKKVNLSAGFSTSCGVWWCSYERLIAATFTSVEDSKNDWEVTIQYRSENTYPLKLFLRPSTRLAVN